ncbi:hypothetical protein LUZ60_010686 [Juncus effusus]|nr:hypothetical protein LUZ60_010686 [Juncus effusus]
MPPFLPLLFFSLQILNIAFSSPNGMRIEMSHIDSKGNFTQDELIARSAFLAKHRRLLIDTLDSVNLPLEYTGQYLIELSIGTPPQPITGIADTGSDLIWTQCYNCKPCFSQPSPLYDPRKSKSASNLPCDCNACVNVDGANPDICCSYSILYGSGETAGILISDTFTLGNPNEVSILDMVFGCTSSSGGSFANSTGIIGLSRSNFSLISQIGMEKFSYCIHPNVKSVSPMFLGSSAVLKGTSVKSTPFVSSPASFYYVSLTGISLGSKLLTIPETAFPLMEDGSGGVIIDSGTPLTRLVPDAFQVLSQEIKSIVNLPEADGSAYHLSLCFSLGKSSVPNMPNITFHFDGADMKLTMDKYMVTLSNGLFCLYILEPSGGITNSIIGTYQMQNMHVLYDLKNDMLSFVEADCSKL